MTRRCSSLNLVVVVIHEDLERHALKLASRITAVAFNVFVRHPYMRELHNGLEGTYICGVCIHMCMCACGRACSPPSWCTRMRALSLSTASMSCTPPPLPAGWPLMNRQDKTPLPTASAHLLCAQLPCFASGFYTRSHMHHCHRVCWLCACTMLPVDPLSAG